MDEFYSNKRVKPEEGDIVSLLDGYDDDTLAKVLTVMKDYSTGALALDRPIAGCNYWNVIDLKIHGRGL